MKKIIFLLSLVFLAASFTPVLAATTTGKKVITKQAVVSTKKPVKKVVKKVTKKTTNKVLSFSAGSSKHPVFSPEAAANAASVNGSKPPVAYEEALRKAEKDCISAHGNKEKLAICDQEFLDAQTLLNQ